MNTLRRRDFLLLRAKGEREAELSCEQLYMRFVDAEADGTTTRLFEMLSADLGRCSRVRLTDRSWLARADLKTRLNGVLDAYVASGGRVTI